ncbi:MAG: MaoC family dehydratase [Bradyrhizobium sp.]|nr:MaoC family dehydratase [Bradyrhizobium sp.]
MLDRDKHVGVVSEPRVIEVEQGFLKFFAKAVGETNPIYFDDEAAQAAGYRAILMPPTYLFSLNMAVPARRGDLFDKENGIGVDISRILLGEEGFSYHRPVCAGDRVTITTTNEDIYDKKGGALQFVVQTTRCHNSDGELCIEARQVTVVRND